MRKTVVSCSGSACAREATAKVAARWSFGSFEELKTFGYACEEHAEEVVARARSRFQPTHLASGEAMGDCDVFQLNAN